MKWPKDIGHLLRLGAIFIGAGILFLAVRSLLVPHSFGKYGHFRGDAVAEIAARPVAFAGRELCEACHAEVVALKNPGKHKGVSCEACHGPQARHADDPGNIIPPKLHAETLCVKCHEGNLAKPVAFPQIASKDHYPGLGCDVCHTPHSPHLDAGGKK
jgi:Cytochrome c554 and c-prime